MSNYIKLYMLAIALLAISYGASTFAMRCQGQIISIGDPQYLVEQECGIPNASHTTNTDGQGDQVFLYYKIDNVLEELQFIDGHLYQIQDYPQ